MEKIKTATVTWITYKNFGTFLQAYALQQILFKLGADNEIISDKRIIKKNRRAILNSKIKYLKFELNSILRLFDKNRRNSDRLYDKFASQYLHINYNWESEHELNDKYDIFLCGSDQIWFPFEFIDPYFYLGFTSKKKIAYAPSIGVSSYPSNKVLQVKPYLEKFSSLSVREMQGKEILEKQFGLNCQVVLDPTLLLDENDWNLFIKDNSKEKYVLCYLLTYNEKYLDFVQNFAKQKSLKLKAFVTDKRITSYIDEPLYVGPTEFLNLIKSSTYFFTDSFHGSIFAIQFHKEFYTFKRFQDNLLNNQNSRLINLFEKLGLSGRFFSEVNLAKIQQSQPIDYLDVRNRLAVERKTSIAYLQKALIL